MAAATDCEDGWSGPGAKRASLMALVTGALRKVARAVQNRRQAGLLASMDDRMLADIGLTRSDVRDAYAEPLWRDPTDILAGRVRDRRRHRPAEFDSAARHVCAPPLTSDAEQAAWPSARNARSGM
jgi:uncharacterized protein YjiS (DUF1127 family)